MGAPAADQRNPSAATYRDCCDSIATGGSPECRLFGSACCEKISHIAAEASTSRQGLAQEEFRLKRAAGPGVSAAFDLVIDDRGAGLAGGERPALDGRAVVGLVWQRFDLGHLGAAIVPGPPGGHFVGRQREAVAREGVLAVDANDRVGRAVEIDHRHGSLWLLALAHRLGHRALSRRALNHRAGHQADGRDPVAQIAGQAVRHIGPVRDAADVDPPRVGDAVFHELIDQRAQEAHVVGPRAGQLLDRPGSGTLPEPPHAVGAVGIGDGEALLIGQLAEAGEQLGNQPVSREAMQHDHQRERLAFLALGRQVQPVGTLGAAVLQRTVPRASGRLAADGLLLADCEAWRAQRLPHRHCRDDGCKSYESAASRHRGKLN